MTNEEQDRQIQSNLDYQTLIMLQQQKAEEENYEEYYEEDKPVKWVNQRVETELGTMSYTNGAVWAWGNVILAAVFIFLFCFSPDHGTSGFVIFSIVLLIFFNIFCKCYAWIKDND